MVQECPTFKKVSSLERKGGPLGTWSGGKLLFRLMGVRGPGEVEKFGKRVEESV